MSKVARLKAKNKRLRDENRRLRKRVEELEEYLAAARQQLRNFQENTAKDQSRLSPFLLDAVGW